MQFSLQSNNCAETIFISKQVSHWRSRVKFISLNWVYLICRISWWLWRKLLQSLGIFLYAWFGLAWISKYWCAIIQAWGSAHGCSGKIHYCPWEFWLMCLSWVALCLWSLSLTTNSSKKYLAHRSTVNCMNVYVIRRPSEFLTRAKSLRRKLYWIGLDWIGLYH